MELFMNIFLIGNVIRPQIENFNEYYIIVDCFKELLIYP